MTASMEDVLAGHYDYGYDIGKDQWECRCDHPLNTASVERDHISHVAEALTAAGFGLLAGEKRTLELAALIAYDAVEGSKLREAAATAWDEGYTTGNAHNGRRDANPYRKASS